MGKTVIPLTQGRYAVVDPEDFEWLNQWKWCVSNSGYAHRWDRGKMVFMHRLVNGTPEGKLTDHINHDKLDNRRSNLRNCDNSANQLNRGLSMVNSSGYVGITWDRRSQKWLARITHRGKQRCLGYFEHIDDAIVARSNAEKKVKSVATY